MSLSHPGISECALLPTGRQLPEAGPLRQGTQACACRQAVRWTNIRGVDQSAVGTNTDTDKGAGRLKTT
jgi:hypothetical protein